MRVYTDDNLRAEPWMEDAACAQISPDLWFPEERDEVTSRDAKRICATCDVLAQCEEYAVRTHQRHGIWAGKNPRTLQRLWKERTT